MQVWSWWNRLPERPCGWHLEGEIFFLNAENGKHAFGGLPLLSLFNQNSIISSLLIATVIRSFKTTKPCPKRISPYIKQCLTKFSAACGHRFSDQYLPAQMILTGYQNTCLFLNWWVDCQKTCDFWFDGLTVKKYFFLGWWTDCQKSFFSGLMDWLPKTFISGLMDWLILSLKIA